MKKSKFIVISLFCIILILGFTVSDTFAQRDGSEENEEIILIKDARKNGYQLSKKKGKFFVQINNVFDPITKKRLEGLRDLKFRCKEQDPIQRVAAIMFKNGSTPIPLLIICEDIDGEALASIVVNKLR